MHLARRLLDDNGTRSGHRRAVACTQCVRVFSTAADSDRFMENQPEPNFPVMEDHLDQRLVVPNMPQQWDDNAPDVGPARVQPPT